MSTTNGHSTVRGNLTGKVALITGGTKGIGRAAAFELASQGASVIVNYNSDSKAADEVVREIGADHALAVKADASSVTGIEGLVKQAVAKFGKIDILVPNAGILPMKDLNSTTEADFDRCLSINVKGPYFLCQKALPYMPEGSHIILVSTSLCAASTVTPNYLLYLTSKGAIEQMTRVLSKQLGPKKISVNAIAPGPTATELFLDGKPEQMIKTIASFSPQNRLGQPEEMAETIGYLAATSWMSGQIVRVNGGMA